MVTNGVRTEAMTSEQCPMNQRMTNGGLRPATLLQPLQTLAILEVRGATNPLQGATTRYNLRHLYKAGDRQSGHYAPLPFSSEGGISGRTGAVPPCQANVYAVFVRFGQPYRSRTGAVPAYRAFELATFIFSSRFTCTILVGDFGTLVWVRDARQGQGRRRTAGKAL